MCASSSSPLCAAFNFWPANGAGAGLLIPSEMCPPGFWTPCFTCGSPLTPECISYHLISSPSHPQPSFYSGVIPAAAYLLRPWVCVSKTWQDGIGTVITRVCFWLFHLLSHKRCLFLSGKGRLGSAGTFRPDFCQRKSLPHRNPRPSWLSCWGSVLTGRWLCFAVGVLMRWMETLESLTLQ